MKRLAISLCLTIAVFFGSVGMGSCYDKPQLLLKNIQKYISENPEKMDWYGLYVKNKKTGFASIGWVIENHKNIKYLVRKIKVVLKQISDDTKETTTYRINEYFDFDTGEFLKCSNRTKSTLLKSADVYDSMVVGDKLLVKNGSGGKSQIPWKRNYDLKDALGIFIWIRSNPEIKGSFSYSTIECSTGEVETVNENLIKTQEVLLGGKKEKKYFTHYTTEGSLGSLVGDNTYLSDGTPSGFSIGPFKLFLESVDLAQSELNYIDLHKSASINISEPIKDFQKLSLLKLRLTTSSPTVITNSFQQQVTRINDVTYSIVLSKKHRSGQKFDPILYTQKMGETARYPINSPKVISVLREILKEATTENEKVWRLLAYVSNILLDDYKASSEDAIQILKRQRGDCTEHALLFVTLARAAGIPAREASGLIYNNVEEKPGFAPHAWVEIVQNGQWVALDPTWRSRELAPIRITLGLTSLNIKHIKVEEKIYNFLAPLSAIKIANKAFKQKKYKKSFSLFKVTGTKEDYYSQFSLGWAFEYGLGVPINYKNAYQWYLKAARQGHSESEYRIGLLYSNGKGFKKDQMLATFWFERSAVGGNLRAAYLLAKAYLNGDGVAQNKDQAILWYEFAASSVME